MGLIIGGVSAHDLILDGSSVSLYAGGNPPVKLWPTSEVHEVSFSGEYGRGKLVPLVSVTIPAGEVWAVRVQGQFTRTTGWANQKPQIRIGPAASRQYDQGEVVDFSGTVSSSDSTIAAIINRNNLADPTDFTGTVTIEK